MSCATVPLEIGVPQQPHHSSPRKRSLMRPKSVARASTPTGFPKASPIVFAYPSSLPNFREDWPWNWCPASSVVPQMIRQEWYPSFWSHILDPSLMLWMNQEWEEIRSWRASKDMPVWIGSKALPFLKPSMLTKLKEWLRKVQFLSPSLSILTTFPMWLSPHHSSLVRILQPQRVWQVWHREVQG